MPANMGLVPAEEGFLELLRERADATGALLILDEVISGFRVARGGAQELSGVNADLTVMGKVIGGGLPAGAVGGRAELMRMLAPAGQVYQAGTLSATRSRSPPALRLWRCSTTAPIYAWRRSPKSWRQACARPRAGGRAAIQCKSSACLDC